MFVLEQMTVWGRAAVLWEPCRAPANVDALTPVE